MDIAIFGGGIAGLMAAITLGAHGHSCRVFERNRQSHEAGMGFILVVEGLRCLEDYGVQMKGELAGVSLERYRYRFSSGEIIHEQSMPEGARSFRRRDLIAALVGALPPRVLTFDAALDGLDFDSEGRVTAAHVASGESLRADLYVAADGIGSRARHALYPDWPEPQARVPEVVGLVRCRETMRWAGSDFNKFHHPDGGIALGVLPVDSDHLVWFLQFDDERFRPPAETPEERHAFVDKLVGDWAHPIPHLLAITDFSRSHVWLPVDADPLPSFCQKNLVLIGDAAHPFVPLTSQGVSAALTDAVALASILADSGGDLSQALPRFSNERREECAPYVERGRQLTRSFLAPQSAGKVVLPIA